MRIQINIDVAEHELNLATELLSVLRSITDELNVRDKGALNGESTVINIKQEPAADTSTVTRNGACSQHGPQHAPASASAAPPKSTPAGGPHSAATKAPGFASLAALSASAVPPGNLPTLSQAHAAIGAQAPKQAAQSAPMQQPGSRPGSQSGSQSAAGSATSADIPSPPGLPPSLLEAQRPKLRESPVPGVPGVPTKPAAPKSGQPTRDEIVGALRKLIEGLDTETDYDLCLDKVAKNLNKVFGAGNLGTEEEAFGKFWDAFRGILWDPERLQAQKSVVNFMNLLLRLPQNILDKAKEPLISQTMRRLTENRPADANRQEFFTDAEIFACIATMRLVGLSGAVKTIIQMLGKDEKRAAAVTMLGKTVEQSADNLRAEVDEGTLGALKAAVDAIKEPQFQYDKTYVYDSMEWGLPPSSPSTPAKGKLLPSTSYKGHSDSVYALAYDAQHSQLASAGKDSSVILWDSHGNPAQRVHGERETCYGGMAMHPDRPILAAVRMGGGSPPHVDILDVGGGSLKRLLQLPRASADLVSCITCLPGSDLFAVGELDTEQGVVSIFDFNSLTSNSAEPIVTLKDDHGTVTCVGPLDTGNPTPNALMSGAKDGTITIWDLRINTPAMRMTAAEGPSASAMVTCFDSRDCVIMAGSLNHHVCQWDVRALASGTGNAPQEARKLDDNAILRIAFGPAAPQAAISTLIGLYYMDPFAEGVHPSYRQAGTFPDKIVQNYPDVKWGKGNDADVLYAACLDGSVDVYKLG